MAKSMMILVAGPYRSGTGDDPARMATNLRKLEEAALHLSAIQAGGNRACG